MSRKNPPKHIKAITTVAAIAMSFALGAATVTLVAEATADETLSSIVRGGRLYDNWQSETRSPVPAEPHPAYPAGSAYAASPEVNWRCKECHGWDYLGRNGAYSKGDHYTGIKGISGMAGADPDKIIAILTDETHGYGGLLADRDLRALANFVSQGQVYMDRFIDRASRLAKGDKTRRQSYYITICATCHGRGGLKIRTMPPLGYVAKENPWEALHKILNGHPAENMPALRVIDMSILVDVLAYVQTLPADEILYSIVRGGRLYDNWLKEIEGRAPVFSPWAYPVDKRHPAYPADRRYAMEPETNWRCKECHGWDYRGKDGAYSEGEHYTGIKGIRAMAGADPERIIATITDETHGYGGLLDDHDLRALANFVSEGQVDMDRFIDRTLKVARGDPLRHMAYYTTICAACHGRDGFKIITMPPLGKVARNNPWETLHRILNGHPAENMPALRALDMSILVDILAYVQTLPAK